MAPLVDAHCHVATTTSGVILPAVVSNDGIQRCIMSTNPYDWNKVKKLSNEHGNYVSFGIHPWYSHLFALDRNLSKQEHYEEVLEAPSKEMIDTIISCLPDPTELQSYIDMEFDPSKVSCIGEIGIDKLFRLPEDGFYKADTNARLSNVRVKLAHQVKVFTVLCGLAVEKSLPVSLHAVKCPGLMFDLCKSLLFPHRSIKICLHSYTGSLDTLKNFWLKELPYSRIYLSLSMWISFKNLESGQNLLRMLPLECTLTETDNTIDDKKGGSMHEQLKYVIHQITAIHQIENVEHSQQIVYDNFLRFISESV